MAVETHVSPSGIPLPDPTKSIEHEDVGPIYVSPAESAKEAGDE